MSERAQGMDFLVWTALHEETLSSRNLLRHAVSLLRHPSPDIAVDALFPCLATGMEKLTKLTVGLVAIDDGASWPSRQTMREVYGHDIVLLDEACRELIRQRLDRAVHPQNMAAALASVEADEVIADVVASMARYATTGRFYNLDLLADHLQPEEPPRLMWSQLEQAVVVVEGWNPPGPPEPHPHDWLDQTLPRISNRIADSVERWWALYARAWNLGLIGRRAQQWSDGVRVEG